MSAGERQLATVLVTGATGYVGSHLVFKLRGLGQPVRCLVRPEASESDLQFLRSLGAEVVATDLDRPGAHVFQAFAGAQAVVHLIGSIAPKKGESFSDLHEKTTGQLIELCQNHNISRVAMVTALGAGPSASSRYHLTKWQAEEVVRASGLEYVILRPSLVVGRMVGRRDSKLVTRYINLILSSRAVPLINGGVNRIQPVFIGDLVEVLSACVSPGSTLEGTLELGGPDLVTMREFVEQLMAVIGERKPIIGLPGFIAQAAAAICESLQAVPLLSNDQVAIANQDNVCQENALVSVCGISPTPLKEALATYRAHRFAQSAADARPV